MLQPHDVFGPLFQLVVQLVVLLPATHQLTPHFIQCGLQLGVGAPQGTDLSLRRQHSVLQVILTVLQQTMHCSYRIIIKPKLERDWFKSIFTSTFDSTKKGITQNHFEIQKSFIMKFLVDLFQFKKTKSICIYLFRWLLSKLVHTFENSFFYAIYTLNFFPEPHWI